MFIKRSDQASTILPLGTIPLLPDLEITEFEVPSFNGTAEKCNAVFQQRMVEEESIPFFWIPPQTSGDSLLDSFDQIERDALRSCPQPAASYLESLNESATSEPLTFPKVEDSKPQQSFLTVPEKAKRKYEATKPPASYLEPLNESVTSEPMTFPNVEDSKPQQFSPTAPKKAKRKYEATRPEAIKKAFSLFYQGGKRLGFIIKDCNISSSYFNKYKRALKRCLSLEYKGEGLNSDKTVNKEQIEKICASIKADDQLTKELIIEARKNKNKYPEVYRSDEQGARKGQNTDQVNRKRKSDVLCSSTTANGGDFTLQQYSLIIPKKVNSRKSSLETCENSKKAFSLFHQGGKTHIAVVEESGISRSHWTLCKRAMADCLLSEDKGTLNKEELEEICRIHKVNAFIIEESLGEARNHRSKYLKNVQSKKINLF